MTKPTENPTQHTYEALQHAYDYFNEELFDGQLKNCLITLQRKDKRSLGYFWFERFAEVKGKARTDEIAINPQRFTTAPLRDVLSTLVHEQVHLWQFHFGEASRKGYHNKQWGAKMKEVGLYPSNTGEVGGKETGQQMTHYIIEGGAFDKACKKLLSKKFMLKWGEIIDHAGDEGDDEGDKKEKNKTNRVKYTCPSCGTNVWGKPELSVMCGECEVPFQPEEE